MAGRTTKTTSGEAPTGAPSGPDLRREQMLSAAVEVICERGFSETRISDVAARADASPALVIYYFGTKDRLLTAALRFSEETFYAECADMLSRTPGLRDRLEMLVRLTCVPPDDDEWMMMSGAGI